jgi:predicted cupin superfamily sugar epimerase
LHPEASRLIRRLDLRPHPEGGYFAQTYRSQDRVTCGGRHRRAITTIHYLLAGDEFSAFHRLQSDEIWHHYAGGSVAIDTIEPEGRHQELVIGDGKCWHAAIAPGVWFAAHLLDPSGYGLVGCDVAPGFEYEDFEVGSRAYLLREFPKLAALIERWTRA